MPKATKATHSEQLEVEWHEGQVGADVGAERMSRGR